MSFAWSPFRTPDNGGSAGRLAIRSARNGYSVTLLSRREPLRLPSYGGVPSSVVVRGLGGGRCQGTRMILPRAVRPEDSASSMAAAASARG